MAFPGLADAVEWQRDDHKEAHDVCLRDEIQQLNEVSRPMGGHPEYKESDDEREGQESRETVGGGVVRGLLRGLTGRVSDQRRDILYRKSVNLNSIA